MLFVGRVLKREGRAHGDALLVVRPRRAVGAQRERASAVRRDEEELSAGQSLCAESVSPLFEQGRDLAALARMN